VVNARTREAGSLLAVLREFSGDPARPRALLPFPDPGATRREHARDRFMPSWPILDPDRPAEEDPFFSQFLPSDRPRFLQMKQRRLEQRLGAVLLAGLLLSLPGVRRRPAVARGAAALERMARGRRPGPAPLVIFAAGAALRVPADVLVFLTCVASRHGRGMGQSLLGLTLVSSGAYALGRGARRWRGTELAPRLPGELARLDDPRAGFWAHTLLQLNLIAPLVRVAYRAGRIGSPALPFLGGTLAGNGARIVTGGITADAFRRAVARPSRRRIAFLAAASACTYLAFRWSSRRFLPTYGSALARAGGEPAPRSTLVA
jgi:hypothetical protein